jgi:predicted outer membrane protein
MSKQMLEDADDFDKAYMGMAVVKHSMMVAQLEAMQDVGSQEFQQLISTAEDKTREHLEQAKKLAKKLDSGDRQATSPGRRASSRQPADQQ